jgi:hypothetical protein
MLDAGAARSLQMIRLPDPKPYPDGDTSPGDEPQRTRVNGHIDPPGWFDDYLFDGSLDRGRLDATIDPRGWFNDIRVTGRVDHGGFETTIDPKGFGNDTSVSGTRTSSGFDGTVDRPGLWNDVRHRIDETVRGGQVLREGRFDERLVPSFSEAVWRSSPVDAGDGARLLEFDPPGWGNTTRVTLEGNQPAGVEASIAAHLFDSWKTELERQDDYPDTDYPDTDYPDTGYPGDTGPGDDSGYPTSPGDDYPIW